MLYDYEKKDGENSLNESHIFAATVDRVVGPSLFY